MIYAEKGMLRITKRDSDPVGLVHELHEGSAMQAAYLQWKLRKMRMNRMALRRMNMTFCKHVCIN